MSTHRERARRGVTAIAAASVLGMVAVTAGCQGKHPDGVTAGTVQGRLVRVGGPAPGSPVPLPGHVTATATGGTPSQTVRVGNNGTFSLNLPVGVYRFTGTSPVINSGKQTCFGPARIHVRTAHATTGIEVVCSIR